MICLDFVTTKDVPSMLEHQTKAEGFRTRLTLTSKIDIGHPSQSRNYTKSPRSPSVPDEMLPSLENMEKKVDEKDQGFLRFITGEARRQYNITQNFDEIMAYKNQRIEDTSEALRVYYADRPQQFDSNDQDLVDKAERHYEHKLNSMDRWADYKTDPEVAKLMDFVTWAKSRGGLSAFASMKSIHKSDMKADEGE